VGSHEAKQGQSPGAVTHQVAVLAVIFAGVITVITANPDRPYTPGDIVIGLTLLLILHAYDVKEGNDERLQTMAFAAAWALSFLILVGYVINFFGYGLRLCLKILRLPQTLEMLNGQEHG
jgi:hypothetical protein